MENHGILQGQATKSVMNQNGCGREVGRSIWNIKNGNLH